MAKLIRKLTTRNKNRITITLQENKEDVKQKHVAFNVDSDKDTDDSQSYVYKVVGGVAQKIPTKGSPSESPVVRRRPKMNRTTKVNRRVSCKDLGKGDAEGWLFKRRTKGGRHFGASHWEKRWCIIKDYSLYCYHHKESEKAELVLELQAFQISPIDPHEIKTKKYAFKIHNTGTTFFFASDRKEDMSKWMNKLGLAAITYSREGREVRRPDPNKYKDRDYYSESDEEDPSSMSSGSRPGSAASSIPDQSTSTSDLHVPPPDLRASTEDLTIIMRKQSQRGQNIFGEDKNIQRKSVLSRELLEKVKPEVAKYKRLVSLERTLKAREKELEELEKVLTQQSPEKLQRLRDFMDMSGNGTPHETDSD